MAAPTLEQLPEEAGLLRTGSPGQADAPPPRPPRNPSPRRQRGTHIQLHQGEQVLCGGSEDGICLLAGDRLVQGTV